MKTASAISLIVGAAATTDVPASFDCGMRKLAYKHGKHLTPRQGNFESLYYALNLNDPDCTEQMVADGPVQLRASSKVAADAVYVDANSGNDGNAGTEQAPL